jgi:16S rRNA C967 or C1407 C5-methylase (RsmB/RsmF family)
LIGRSLAFGTRLEEPIGEFVAIGRLSKSTESIFKEREGLAVSVQWTEHSMPPLNGLLVGLIYPQNFPSILVAHELEVDNISEDHTILDMCAAPGGTSYCYP